MLLIHKDQEATRPVPHMLVTQQMSDLSQPQTALLMQESVLSSKSKSSMAANAPILSGGVTT